MTKVLAGIEAAFVAIPRADATDEARATYVEELLALSAALGSSAIQIGLSSCTVGVLMEASRLPDMNALRSCLGNVPAFDGPTVFRVVQKLFDMTPTLQDCARSADFLSALTVTDPDLSASALHPALANNRERVLGFLAMYTATLTKFSVAICADATCRRTLLSMRVAILESDINPRPELPWSISTSIGVSSSAATMMSSIDAIFVWLNAEDPEEIGLSITASFAQRGLPILPREFRVGAGFLDSLRTTGHGDRAQFAQRAITSACDSIAKENLPKTHALRTNDGGSSPQRMRGLDRAMRRDIDYEFHLHYWECEDGTVELAKIVSHNDFSI